MSTQEERILNSGYRAQSAMYRSPCVSPRSGACARTPCDSWVKAKAKSKSISDNVGLGHNTSRQRESNTFSHFTSATAHHISWLSLGSVCASYTSNHLGAFLSRLNLVQKNKTSAAGPKKSIYHICTAQAAVAFSSRDAHPGGSSIQRVALQPQEVVYDLCETTSCVFHRPMFHLYSGQAGFTGFPFDYGL